MSAGHVGGTRGSGIVSSAADVLWMSVGAWDERKLGDDVYVFGLGRRGWRGGEVDKRIRFGDLPIL